MFTKRIRASAWLLAIGLTVGGATVASADDYKKSSQKHGQMERTRQMGEIQKTQTRTLQGRVTGLKSVRFRGSDQRHLVAMIRTQQGKRAVVDLGPRRDAQRLDLQLGDQLTARGQIAQVQGRSILVAKQARTQDAQLQVDRSMQRRQLQREMRRAEQQQQEQQQQGIDQRG